MSSILTKIYRVIPQRIRRPIENNFKYSKLTNRTNEVIKFHEDNNTSIAKQDTVNFLKNDVEGWEQEVLKGAQKIIKNNNSKIALCTYHKKEDAKVFSKQLESENYEVKFSKGYMIYSSAKDYGVPYLRKGLIRATKHQ